MTDIKAGQARQFHCISALMPQKNQEFQQAGCIMENDASYLLSDYDYELPAEQIAQFPARVQGASRLCVINRHMSGKPVHASFTDLMDHLPKRAVIVANNARVSHARLIGQRESGGKAELLLLTPAPLIAASARLAGSGGRQAIVDGLIKPSRKIKAGDILSFSGGILATILVKGDFGHCKALLEWSGELEEALDRTGRLPLPPYIDREAAQEDELRYQTVYASKPGSIAAPTAGLHFTEQMKKKLSQNGFDWLELTLHVGYGTFNPVRCKDIRQHKMHAEYLEIGRETIRSLRQARDSGRPIIAVGTTSLRSLETLASQATDQDHFCGWTNIFIYPGYRFRLADGLITNFHLPKSSLLMLVSAFAGRQKIMAAYRECISKGYRFFSYGDAMLIR